MEKLRVVLAENESVLATTLKGQLERLGHEVIGLVQDGSEAIKLVREVRPDLVVLDVRMPSVDGIETAREISGTRPTPIVMVSAFTNRELVENANRAGAGAYLTKPVSDRELEKGITVALTRFREIEIERQTKQGFARLAEEQKVLLETSRSVSASLDVKQVLENLAKELSRAVRVNHCIVFLLDENKLEFEVQSTYPATSEGSIALLGRRMKLESAAFAYTCIYQKEAVSIENIVYSELPPELRDVVMRLRISSVLLVPVVLRGRVIAVAMLADNRSHEFNESERILSQTIINQAAIAIENAKLFQRVEQAKREWEGTFDAISDYISIHDRHCRILRANIALSKRLGTTPRELVGKLCYRSINSNEACWEHCPHLITLRTGLPASAEMEVPNLGGTFEISTYPLFENGQKAQAIVHSARDITDVKKAQERIREEAEVSSALLEVSESVNNFTSVDDLLKTTCMVTAGLVNVEYCAVWLWDKRQQLFLPGQAIAKDGNVSFKTLPMRPGELELADHLLKSQASVALNESVFAKVVPSQSIFSFSIKTILALPLRSKGQVMGAMMVMHSVTDHQFSPKEMNIITGIANQVAVTIENMALRQHDISAFYELSQFPGTRMSVEQLSAGILDRVASVFECDAGYLWIRDYHNSIFETKASWGQAETLLPSSRWMTDDFAAKHVDGKAPSPAVFKRGDELWGVINPFGKADLVLVSNMRVERELIGAVAIAFVGRDAPSKERLVLFTTLAGQAGLVIRNAQLYLAAQELAISEERGRIAREMHDGVAQNLAYLMMKTELISRLIDMDPIRARQEVVRMRSILEDSVHELRRSIYALRPVSLEAGGLFAALRKLVKDFSDQNDLDIELILPNGNMHLSAKLEGAVFRVAQEALNNIQKHCQASHVSVRINLESGDLQLVIEDNGGGFVYDEAASTQQGHLGLAQMRERAEELGGTISIESFPLIGTKIVAVFPL